MLLHNDITVNIFCFDEALKMNDAVGKVVESESDIFTAYDNYSYSNFRVIIIPM
jgi:protein SERAC1